MNSEGRQFATVRAAVLVGQSPDQEISQFYAAHHNAVRGFLIYACGCPEHDADDIVQDTILVIRERHWPTVRAFEKPEAYWFKAAQRRCHRILSQRAKRIIMDGELGYRLLGITDPVDQFTAVDRRHALIARIRELPPRQRQVLWLRMAEDFSESDTAEILGISGGSVKRQLHDARERLRELLRNDGVTWEVELL